MEEQRTKGEMHGCIVCGCLYQMYVVYDARGNYVDCTVMTAGGRPVHYLNRPLVSCTRHAEDEVKAAVRRVYGHRTEDG